MKHIIELEIELETEDGSQAESAVAFLREAPYVKSVELRSAVAAPEEFARQEITRYLNPLKEAQVVVGEYMERDGMRERRRKKREQGYFKKEDLGPKIEMPDAIPEVPIWVDDRNRLTVLMNEPGESNDAHWHADFDEWWMVLEGEIDFEIGYPAGRHTEYQEIITIHAKKGDLVFCPKGLRHHIRTVGTATSYRLAVATPTAPHVYTDMDVKEWRGDQFVDASTVEAPSLRQPDDAGPYEGRN